MVRYGDPVRIAADVFRAAERTFRVNHPVVAK
jgi:hypothetical protein